MTPTIEPEEAGVLEQEVPTWLAHRDELIRQAPGKIVVIKGTTVFGIFDNEAEAYAQAYRLYGNVPLLIRPVQMEEQVYHSGGAWINRPTEEDSLATHRLPPSWPQKEQIDAQHQA